MVSLSPLLLRDLCGARIAYLMWTRHDLSSIEDDWESLEEDVLAEAQDIHLPNQLKQLILKHMKFAGDNLFILLTFWFSKTQPMSCQKWLPVDFLFDCLILNGDGLINYRQTALKILVSKTLHTVFAFRLACVNFLEEEIFKLWPHVKQYFLNKITFESERIQIIKEDFSFSKPHGAIDWGKFCFYDNPSAVFPMKMLKAPCSMEPREVLYWISCCISKENGTSLREMPSISCEVPVEEFIIGFSVYSGNIAYFDYCWNCSDKKISDLHKYIHKDLLKHILHPAWFVSLYTALNPEDRDELFQKDPRVTLCRFLQWPLSYTFKSNPKIIWNLIPDDQMPWLFTKLFSIIFAKNRMLNPIVPGVFRQSIVENTRLHLNEHLEDIFISLWEISPDVYKYRLLNSYVVDSICRHFRCTEKALIFETSDLKQKLFQLFITNGKAVLELYAGSNMRSSMRKLVKEYMPNDYEDLNRRWISFLEEKRFNYTILDQLFDSYTDPIDPEKREQDLQKSKVNINFLNYIKSYLFSSNRNISATNN